jgi:mono/diheme cytochrome c family protein
MRRLFALLAIALTAACGEKSPPADSSMDTGAAQPAAAAGSFDPATITPAMLALGDSLYHGLIGATSCQACHGPDGTQGTVAPNLVDADWLHSDGSWEGIFKTVVAGVSAPKQFTTVMPPYGGAPMSVDQTRAVAAYVYKLGHK